MDTLASFAPDKESLYITGIVIAFSVLGKLLIPGEWVQGSLLRDGKSRVWYKLNGLYIVLAGIAAYVACSTEFGIVKLFSAKIIYQHYTHLLGTLIIVSFVISVFLFLRAILYLKKEQLNDHGGNIFERFFVRIIFFAFCIAIALLTKNLYFITYFFCVAMHVNRLVWN